MSQREYRENTKAKDRATYEISGFSEPIEGKLYRLLAVKSTSTMSDVDEKLECEKNDLVKLANSTFPEDFKCDRCSSCYQEVPKHQKNKSVQVIIRNCSNYAGEEISRKKTENPSSS